jgi:hypothetical protein
MNNEIEILKIGSIVTTKQSNGLRRLNIVCDGGPIFDYYKDIVIQYTSNMFEFYETLQIYVGGPFPYNDPRKLVGHLENKPIIGQPLTLKIQRWYSSIITNIINDFIIITKNSVYVIHDLSNLRDQKLQNIGI